VNWVRPENATLTDPVVINVAPFTPALMPAYPVPQPSPGTPLEAIGDRPMFRLAYRNFGDHETLVVNHTVIVDGRHGVRWYELRPNQNPVVYQQGTYAPGDVFRWVGSIAMDSAGDIAIGYSASSNAIYPAIRYTGRVPGDPSGTLEGERSIVEGGGAETVAQGHRARWGDYSSLTLDPDDCTFWYTNQYLRTNGDATNWDTKISSFRFRACGSAGSRHP